MRLSEKTLELNICSQLSVHSHGRLVWFGLTQRQEARAGFDALTRIGGKLIVLQFKASNKVVRRGRRFQLPHHQFLALLNRCRPYRRSVFYVFPLVGNTLELSLNSDLLSQSWVLDVAAAPPLRLPTTSRGTPRASRIHYAYVRPGFVTLASKSVQIQLISLEEVSRGGFSDSEGLQSMATNFEAFWAFARRTARPSVGLVIPPKPAAPPVRDDVRRIRP